MNVLILSTQFPYPPHSGFETRVYQLTRQIAARHNVTLVSYASPDERQDAATLAEELPVQIIERVEASVGTKRVAQALSIASPRPFSCRHVYSEKMQRVITDLCSADAFDVVQLESTLFCQFDFPPHVKVVLDEHNIEYELFWRMCQGERSTARRAFNRVEYARFRRFEQRSWRQVDGCFATSGREVEIVRTHAPDVLTAVVPNGVDLDFFQPGDGEIEPHTMVFNGVLEYRPNLDAALHLVEDIWPLVVRRCPDARLTFVGRAPAADARRLARPGVEVLGEVPDIRPHLERAAVVAVPIRMGGGTRLKVVEGLAMGKAMVSTSTGCEGIDVRDDEHLLIGDTAETFASGVLQLFDDPALGLALGRAGRLLVEGEYSWNLAGDRVEALYTSLLGSVSTKPFDAPDRTVAG